VAKRKGRLARVLGWRVRQLRTRREWTQEELAEHARLHRSYIAGIEAGLRNPSVQVLSKIARGLEISLSELFEEIDDNFQKRS
jgi:transcriptional regulator with XRE-family HTH domain